MRVAAGALAAALLTACGIFAGGRGETRLALVIGNGAYENAPALKNPANDATDMCAVLKKLRFKTLCHTDVRSRAEFEAHVQQYVSQLTPNTAGVVYYSGHGVQVNNVNYLIPTQVQPKSVADDPLRVLYGINDLYARLREKPTRFQLIVLDACRTDLFAPAPKGVPTTAAHSTLLKSLDSGGRARSGLGAITDAPLNTIVFYATGSEETAFGSAGRNSPLTKHILRRIDARGVEVKKFIDTVSADVANETERDYRSRKTPFNYGSFSGEFCFAGCARPDVPPIH
jgi:uncharacterized caspase-like protein